MVKISAALKHFQGNQSRNSRILEDVLEKCRARESHCRAAARRQMQTYGLLYKQGHFVKNWQTRLFILSGGQLKYYVPGDTEAKGTIMLHQIKSVQAVTVSPLPSPHSHVPLRRRGRQNLVGQARDLTPAFGFFRCGRTVSRSRQRARCTTARRRTR